MLNDLKIDCSPHGFRSSFRSWCSDEGIDRELACWSAGARSWRHGERSWSNRFRDNRKRPPHGPKQPKDQEARQRARRPATSTKAAAAIS